MFQAIGRFAVRFRWLVLVAWIVAIPLLTANLPNINDVSKNNNSDFLPKNSPSVEAVNLESNFQKKDTAGTSVIVASRESGTLTKADNLAIDRVIAKVKRVHGISELHDKGISADGHARQLLV